jgi:hypothetical protein
MGIFASIGAAAANATIGKVFDIGNNAVKGYFDTKAKEIAAMNDQDRQAATLALETTKVMIEERRIEVELLKLEQGHWYTRMVRPTIAWIVIIFLGKIFIWDKVLGAWTKARTDDLSENLWWIVTTVIVAYFGGRTVEKTAGIIGAVFKGRR